MGPAALPLDRPLLRVANALSWASTEGATSTGGQRRLANVHAGLPVSGVSGGTQHVVSGDYEYFHYLQVSLIMRPS